MKSLTLYNHLDCEKLSIQEDTDLSCCSEAQLWGQFKSGNKHAFDIIYDRFFQALCGYGDRICEDKSLVEDVVQDLFIYLWSKRESLGKTDAIKYYLFLCLRRKLLRTLAQEKRRGNQLLRLERENHSFHLSLNLSSGVTSEEEEIRNQLVLALDQLTDRQKEAIYLKFYNNLSFQEVASIMEIDVRSVYNLVSRTIDILRRDLKHVHSEISSALISPLIFALLHSL